MAVVAVVATVARIDEYARNILLGGILQLLSNALVTRHGRQHRRSDVQFHLFHLTTVLHGIDHLAVVNKLNRDIFVFVIMIPVVGSERYFD